MLQFRDVHRHIYVDNPACPPAFSEAFLQPVREELILVVLLEKNINHDGVKPRVQLEIMEEFIFAIFVKILSNLSNLLHFNVENFGSIPVERLIKSQDPQFRTHVLKSI